MLSWEYEDKFSSKYKSVCGVDEAGRGCLCGPVFAAAVILPRDFSPDGINDSKKLSPKKRAEAYDKIVAAAISYSTAMATPLEIDEINILNATFLAMNRAINNLSQKADFALIDGNRAKNIPTDFECIVKGDGISVSIAAASIIAKVTRDRFMENLAKDYPQYLLEIHKGYPTAAHYKALRENGIADIYRKTFLKKIH